MHSEDTATRSPTAQDDAQQRGAFVKALATGDIDRIRAATRDFLHHTNSPARTARFIRGAIQKGA